mmetsp:Transcript_102487/g.306166  ORF Transcript_102487/g.306166 Transcript_102487/m.306166 type:complete len:240 (-) Transcript_102487:624-1343(-)
MGPRHSASAPTKRSANPARRLVLAFPRLPWTVRSECREASPARSSAVVWGPSNSASGISCVRRWCSASVGCQGIRPSRWLPSMNVTAELEASTSSKASQSVRARDSESGQNPASWCQGCSVGSPGSLQKRWALQQTKREPRMSSTIARTRSCFAKRATRSWCRGLDRVCAERKRASSEGALSMRVPSSSSNSHRATSSSSGVSTGRPRRKPLSSKLSSCSRESTAPPAPPWAGSVSRNT